MVQNFNPTTKLRSLKPLITIKGKCRHPISEILKTWSLLITSRVKTAITGNYHAKLIGKLCQAIKNNRREETQTARPAYCLFNVQRVAKVLCSFKRSNWFTKVHFVRAVTVCVLLLTLSRRTHFKVPSTYFDHREWSSPSVPHVNVFCVTLEHLYCIVVGSRRLMTSDALQPKAYCTNPGL